MLLPLSSVFTWASWDRESDVNLQGTKDRRAANTEEAHEEMKRWHHHLASCCVANTQHTHTKLQQLTRGYKERRERNISHLYSKHEAIFFARQVLHHQRGTLIVYGRPRRGVNNETDRGTVWASRNQILKTVHCTLFFNSKETLSLDGDDQQFLFIPP